MKCERCGGPAPVEGETYRHYWPCGCAVVPDAVEARSATWASPMAGERYYAASGLGVTKTHPTRDGAIAAWRAALGPYRAPRVAERDDRTLVDINRTDPPMLTREAPKPEAEEPEAMRALRPGWAERALMSYERPTCKVPLRRCVSCRSVAG